MNTKQLMELAAHPGEHSSAMESAEVEAVGGQR